MKKNKSKIVETVESVIDIMRSSEIERALDKAFYELEKADALLVCRTEGQIPECYQLPVEFFIEGTELSDDYWPERTDKAKMYFAYKSVKRKVPRSMPLQVKRIYDCGRHLFLPKYIWLETSIDVINGG